LASCHRIERVANEAGAIASFQHTSIHAKVTLTYGGRSRFVIISGTPSDKNVVFAVLSDVRRTLRELGYVEPPKVAKPKVIKRPWRNRPQVTSPPISSGPRYRHRYRDEVNAMTVPLRELRERLAS
jgi:hypothetical protein